MTCIEIVKKSIAHMDTDCIVVPSSQSLIPTGGAAEAVFKAAGYEDMKNACAEIGTCAVGDVVVTPGFCLNAQYVLHTVGPSWIDGKHYEQNRLRDCYRKILRKAKELGCASIALPLISAGLKGYPPKEAWEIAIRTVLSEKSNVKVYFAVVDDHIYDVGQQILLHSSIDAEIFEAIDRNMLQQNIKNVCNIFVGQMGNLKEETDWNLRIYPTAKFDPERIARSLLVNRKYKEVLQTFICTTTLNTSMSAAEIICELAYYPRADRHDWNYISKRIRNGDLLKLLLRLDDLYVQWYAE